MRNLSLFAVLLVGCGNHGTMDPCESNPAECTCTGQCAPLAGNYAGIMLYVWHGPAGSTPPMCPAVTPGAFAAFLDNPPASITCSPQCTCGPSANTCYPPATITANSAVCPANGGSVQHTPFDGPAVWDGTCTTQDAVSAADSVTVSPGQLGTGASCEASTAQVTHIAGAQTIAQGCTAVSQFPAGVCPSADQTCAYAKADGFSVCLLGEGDCPAGWSDTHTIFQKDVMCACSCGNPTGELCSATFTVYGDKACSSKLGSVSVSSDGQAECVNVAPGSALGSKTATSTYTPGTCEPTLTKAQSSTLCCLP
jgi:hypothetical protein